MKSYLKSTVIYFIVPLFNGIALLSFLIHAKTLRPVLLKAFSHAFKNSPELNTESIRLKFLMFTHQFTNHDLNLKTLIHGHHSSRNECFVRAFFPMTVEKKTMKDLYHNFCIFWVQTTNQPFRCRIKLGLRFPVL